MFQKMITPTNGGDSSGKKYVDGIIGTVSIPKNTTYQIDTGLSNIDWFMCHAIMNDTVSVPIIYDSNNSGKYESGQMSHTQYSGAQYGGTLTIGTAPNYSLGIASISGGVVTLMAASSASGTTYASFTEMYWIAREGS